MDLGYPVMLDCPNVSTGIIDVYDNNNICLQTFQMSVFHQFSTYFVILALRFEIEVQDLGLQKHDAKVALQNNGPPRPFIKP